ncbi:tryptophan 7-halogenase [Parvularcula dongshanensis]|uniref:Tryptophan halogenase n=1 Tax=Parvularcula dongshanensis TaxID=1173995 RepID=A0A840I673_9PROT|nr:tryptophan 7-halogenase [Parvularcula dongshanensis]MBB4659684.1 tryptophan halogenase [Parvularcula dongshanensis]
MTRPVESVAIMGCDAACWLTALALQRAFGDTGVEVRVVELPTQLTRSDVFATLPTVQGLHRMLRVEESFLVQHCKASFSFGQRFSGWARSLPPFMHAYDTYGAPMLGVPFLQYWLKARKAGLNLPLEDFSLGAVAAKQGKRALLSEQAAGFSRAGYGYHLDAMFYLGVVRQLAVEAGVKVERGVVQATKWEGERLEAVRLHDGRQVEADLFVDATGPEALLLRDAPGDGFEPWSRWLPTNRVLTGSAQPLTPKPAFAQNQAFRAGWISVLPLQDRTAVSVAFDDEEDEAESVLETVPALTGLRVSGEVASAKLVPGARRRPWIGNCVAIGEAAAALDPLDAVPLHLVQIGISHLVTRFPVDADYMQEARRYNELVFDLVCRVRDYQILHYTLNKRRDDPLWDRARDARPPEELAYKIETFAACGIVPLYDNETFQEPDWTASLIGHGVVPDTYDPMVDAMPEAEQMQRFQQMLGFIAAEIAEMDSVDAYLETHGSLPSFQANF